MAEDSQGPVYGSTPMMRVCALAIAELTDAAGIAPTYDELAAELDTTRANVHRLVHGLADRGWLTFRKNHERSIRLLRRPAPLPEYPVAVTETGRAAAGAFLLGAEGMG